MPVNFLNAGGPQVAHSLDGLLIDPYVSTEAADEFRAWLHKWGPRVALTTDFDAGNVYAVYVSANVIGIACRPVAEGLVSDNPDVGQTTPDPLPPEPDPAAEPRPE